MNQAVRVPLLASVSALAICGYLGAVWVQGQLGPLFTAIHGDWQFLEWVAAVGVLYWLSKQEYLSGPVSILMGLGAFALFLKLAGNSTIRAEASSFASGDQNFWQFFQDFFGSAGKMLGLQGNNALSLPGLAGRY